MKNIFKSQQKYSSEQMLDLLTELKSLSKTSSIEIQGNVHFCIGDIGYVEPACLAIDNEKFTVVLKPTEYSYPGSAFWSTRTFNVNLTRDGELHQPNQRRDEYYVFRCSSQEVTKLLGAKDGGYLTELLKNEENSRQLLIQTQGKIQAIFYRTLGIKIDRHHPYVYWTTEALGKANVGADKTDFILAAVEPKLRALNENLRTYLSNFGDNKYHKVVRRKIYEGVRAGLLVTLPALKQSTSKNGALSRLMPLVSQLKDYIHRRREHTPQQVHGLMKCLLEISKEHAIKLPGVIAEDFGSWYDTKSAWIHMRDGNLNIIKNAYTDVDTTAQLKPGITMRAELMDNGKAVYIEPFLVTDHIFTVDKDTIKSLMPIFMKGPAALRKWAAQQSSSVFTLEDPVKANDSPWSR